MRLHHFEFFGGESPGLAQNGVIHGDLANIMHRSRRDNVIAEVVVDAEALIFFHLFHEDPHNVAGTLDMPTRGIVAALDHRQHPDHEALLQLHDVLALLLDVHFEPSLVLLHREIVAEEAADREHEQSRHYDKADGARRIKMKNVLFLRTKCAMLRIRTRSTK